VEIVLGVIITNDDILDITVTVGNQEGGQTRAIWDDLGGDVLSLDSVFTEVIIGG
jgi:hypothetical protein